MNVFISQTTGKSQEVAKVVRDWLRDDMSSCDPWMSPLDIKGGDNWREEINNALKKARYGIVFLTTENLKNPWIFFEVGVLILKGINIFPYAIDLASFKEMPAPINHLQGRRVNKAATKELVVAIHTALKSPIPIEVLLRTFEKKWKKLEKDLKHILEPSVDDINEIIDDFTEILLKVNEYRESLEFSANVDEVIDSLLEMKNNREIVDDDVYKEKEDKVVESVYEKIEKEREPFEDVESKLVGKVGKFFRDYFTKEDLRSIIIKLSPTLRSADLPLKTKREELKRLLKIEESGVYLHYHQILLNKLKARIGRK